MNKYTPTKLKVQVQQSNKMNPKTLKFTKMTKHPKKVSFKQNKTKNKKVSAC